MDLQKILICYLSLFRGISLFFMVSKSNSCLYGDEVLLLIREISFGKCVEECALRSHCEAVSYRRLFHLCELLKDVNGNVLSRQFKKKDCILLEKSDWNAYKIAQCDCSIGETCDITTKACQTIECLKLELANGRILGNMLSVGSRVRSMCNSGYVETSGERYALCDSSGNWSYQPECIRDCGTYPNIANANVVGGGISTTEGAVVTYDCISGYTFGGSMTSLTCTSDGIWFDQNEVYCQYENTIGSTCSGDSDCLSLTGGQCVENKCFCSPLYRYDSTINDCSKVCTSYSNAFMALPNTAAFGYNDIANGEQRTLSDCSSLCENDPSCLSFEIYEEDGNTKCTRGSVTYEMIHDADASSITNTRDMYSRVCI